MKETITLKLRKGQKCWLCKKVKEMTENKKWELVDEKNFVKIMEVFEEVKRSWQIQLEKAEKVAYSKGIKEGLEGGGEICKEAIKSAIKKRDENKNHQT